MASVIRVKRRMGEDPAEALLLSCKRIRCSENGESTSDIESVLSFAGTITSKTEPVSAHIKEAIKQKKLHREQHPSSADYKHFHSSPQSLTSRVRKQKAQSSHNNRYRILSGKRAIDLADLDKESELELLEETSEHKKVPEGTDMTSLNFLQASDNKENSSITETQNSSGVSQHKVQCVSEKDGDRLGREDLNKTFCIFDLEKDIVKQDPFFGISQQSASGITLNNVPLMCRKAEPEATDDSQFVYDLYYTHNNLTDLDLHAALTVEALCDAAFMSELVQEEEFVNEDSDDSNEENNWRNDYPDEDPHFFENEDYDYAEDMVDTGYLNDDESDLLSYWMDSRCRVESRSDDDEDDYGNDDVDTLED